LVTNRTKMCLLR